MTISRSAERHPYWFVTIMETMVVFVYLVAGTIAYFLNLSNMELYGLANLGLTLITIVLLTRLKWWKAVGFKPLRQRGDLFYFILPLVPMVFNMIPGVEIKGFVYVSEVFAITLLVGFAEEVIFRGLMLQALRPLGHWRAVIISALLFGLAHALNALAGKSVLDGAIQIFYAAGIGFGYAALALKKNVLWPLVLTHFLTDFAYFVQKPGLEFTPFWQAFIVAGLAVVFTVYGVCVMRNKSQELEVLR